MGDTKTERNSSWHKYTLRTRTSATYIVTIGQKHSCQCPDFAKHKQKQLCKHIIWVLLFICNVPESCELLQQIFLTDLELSEILNNTPLVPRDLRDNGEPRRENRTVCIESLFRNDPRNSVPRQWVLGRKVRKRGTTPQCRNCRLEQLDGEMSVSVTALHVPYQQNVVVESTFYFCPKVQCLNRVPPWINVKPPATIVADESVTQTEITHLKAQGLNIQSM